MSLPAAAKNHHHRVGVRSGSTAHPVLYAVDGDRLVCFGDESLLEVPDHAHVAVSIHEIAGGQVMAQFGASLHLLLA